MKRTIEALASVIESSSTLMFLILPSGTVRAVSPGMWAWLSARAGISRGELPNVAALQRRMPEVAPYLAEILGSALAGRPTQIEAEGPYSQRLLRVEGTPVPLGHGCGFAAIVHVADLTEQRRAERLESDDVQAEEALLHGLDFPLVLVEVADDGAVRFVRTNPTAARLLRTEAAALVGLAPTAAAPPGLHDAMAATERLAREAVATRTATQAAFHGDVPGLGRTWLLRAIPTSRDGGSRRAIVLSMPVPDEPAVEAPRAAPDADDTAAHVALLSAVNHELRTPLNGVIGFAEVLRTTALTPEQHDYLGQLRRQAEELYEILERMIDLERTRADVDPRESRPVDVLQAVRQAAASVRDVARASGVTITHSGTGDEPPILLLDPLRLRQVLSHVVRASLETGQGGALVLDVSVVVHGDDAVLTITVTRRGTGVHPFPPELLLAPFSTDPEVTTRWAAGRRLGVTLAARLLQREHGDLRVEPTPPGSATLVATLPARVHRPLPAEAQLEAFLAARARDGRVVRALVVEDSVVNQRIAVSLLTRAGIPTEVAADGVEGLERMADHTYDLVLLDLALPRLDGLTTARELRARHGGGPYLCGYTAYATPEHRRQCAEAGMDDFLAKPVDMTALRAVLARMVDRLATEREHDPIPGGRRVHP